MTKATIALAPFGKAPKIDNVTLPTVRTIADDNKLGEAIGRVGGGAGGLQRLMCSTAYYLGDMAKKAKETEYNGDTYWEGFYSTHYAASPLSEDSQKQAKSNALVYVKVAMLPYDARELAEQMFHHAHGSMNQKATALRSLIKDHKTEAPSAKEWKAILPAAPVKTVNTIVDRAKDVYNSLNNVYVRRDKDDTKAMWTGVNANAELKARYDAAVAAAKSFFEMAETIANKKKGKKLTAAQIKAAAKAGKPEGATVN